MVEIEEIKFSEKCDYFKLFCYLLQILFFYTKVKNTSGESLKCLAFTFLAFNFTEKYRRRCFLVFSKMRPVLQFRTMLHWKMSKTSAEECCFK